jgi:glyoxylase-like metal-dependent hydrolase (beta-lactamase superfamily II)
VADNPDDDTAIVVDTGVKATDENGKVRGRKIEGGGPAPILSGMAEYGVSPGEVDYVILTHLHWDHADNNEMFPNAEFLVQKDELEHAQDPIPP